MSSYRDRPTSSRRLKVSAVLAAAGLTFTSALTGFFPESDSASAITPFERNCSAYGGTPSKNSKGETTCGFDYSLYSRKMIIPNGGLYKLQVWGASGSKAPSTSKGGYAEGVVYLNTSEAIDINTGGFGTTKKGGSNGGGPPGFSFYSDAVATGGGGASDVRRNGESPQNRIIVAGGGGGISGDLSGNGHGGGLNGVSSSMVSKDFNCENYRSGGGGGKQTSGGVSGGVGAGNGSFFKGGEGSPVDSRSSRSFGGGGGGGYYGGGGGGVYRSTSGIYCSGGGGGGSSYISGLQDGVTKGGNETQPSPSTYSGSNDTQEGHDGNGFVVITEIASKPKITTTTSLLEGTVNVGTLDYTGSGDYSDEKIRYLFTVNNPSAKSDLTNASVSVSGIPSGWSCDPVKLVTGSNTVPKGESSSWEMVCSAPKTWFVSSTSATQPLPTLSATLNGDFEGSSLSGVISTSPAGNATALFYKASVTSSVGIKSPSGVSKTTVDLGDQITYLYFVKNSGTSPLKNLRVDSALFQGRTVQIGAPSSIAPGATDTISITMTALATDTTGSALLNTAKVYADSDGCSSDACPTVLIGEVSNSTPTTKTEISLSSVEFVLVQDVAPSGVSAGDRGFSRASVLNSGNVSLSKISVRDSGGRSLTGPSTLAAGASGTYVSTNYDLTAEDVKTSIFAQKATVSAQLSNCSTSECPKVTDEETKSYASVPYSSKVSITPTTRLVGDLNNNGLADVGDTVVHRVMVRNEGNVSLNFLSVTDSSSNMYDCVATPTNLLAPSAGKFCERSFIVQASHIKDGTLSESFTVKSRGVYGGEEDSVVAETKIKATHPFTGVDVQIVAKNAETGQTITSGSRIPSGSKVRFEYLFTNTGTIPSIVTRKSIQETVSGVVRDASNDSDCRPKLLMPGENYGCILETDL